MTPKCLLNPVFLDTPRGHLTQVTGAVTTLHLPTHLLTYPPTHPSTHDQSALPFPFSRHPSYYHRFFPLPSFLPFHLLMLPFNLNFFALHFYSFSLLLSLFVFSSVIPSIYCNIFLFYFSLFHPSPSLSFLYSTSHLSNFFNFPLFSLLSVSPNPSLLPLVSPFGRLDSNTNPANCNVPHLTTSRVLSLSWVSVIFMLPHPLSEPQRGPSTP